MDYVLNIAKYRIQRNLTQAQLAKAAGISQSHLSALELNRKSPTLRTVFNIGKALGVCPNKLIDFNRACKRQCNDCTL